MMPTKVGRSPHGERGLKSASRGMDYIYGSRSPHGERGLKLFSGLIVSREKAVAPHTGSVD